jgi:hypothetical protein
MGDIYATTSSASLYASSTVQATGNILGYSSGLFGGTTTAWKGASLAIEQQTTGPSFVVGDTGTATPFLYVDGHGNVGVGTSVPSRILNNAIGGNNLVVGSSPGNTGRLVLQSQTPTMFFVDTNSSAPVGQRVGALRQDQGVFQILGANDTGSLNSNATMRFNVADGRFEIGDGGSLFDGQLAVYQTGTGDIFNLFDGGSLTFSVLDGGSVGIGGTSTPVLTGVGDTSFGGAAGAHSDVYISGGLGVGNATTSDGDFVVGNDLYLYSNGKIGVGTSTPWGQFSVDQLSGQGRLKPVFVVGDTGTTTPFQFISQKGVIGFGTSAPTGLFLNPGDVAIGRNGASSDLFVSGGLGVGNATTADGAIEVSDRIVIANSGFISGSKICTAGNGLCAGGSSNPNLVYQSFSGTKYFTASSTADNLAFRFDDGFVSSASSSIAGNLYVSGDYFLGGTTTQPLADFALGGGDNTTADAYISGGLGVGNATTADGALEIGNGLFYVSAAGNVVLPGLTNCNGASTLDTDANGIIVCGADASSGTSVFTNTGNAVYLADVTDDYLGTGTSSPALTGQGDLSVGGASGSITADLYVSGGLGVGNATTSDGDLAIGDDFFFYKNRRFGIGTTSPNSMLSIDERYDGGTRKVLSIATTTIGYSATTTLIQIGYAPRADYKSSGNTAMPLNTGLHMGLACKDAALSVTKCNFLSIEGVYGNSIASAFFVGSHIFGASGGTVAGIGTSTPALTEGTVGGFGIGVDTYIAGGLGVGDATTSDGNISFGGNPNRIGGGANGRIYGAGTSTIASLVMNEFNATGPTFVTDGAIALGSIGTGATHGRFWVRSRGTTFRFASNSNAADYSEFFYQGDNGAEEGDIMSVSTEAPPTAYKDHGRVQKATMPYERSIVGVITNPDRGTNFNDPNWDGVPNFDMSIYANVGMLGHIMTKVSTENGPIAVGDRITSSSIPGVGMKATEEGPYVGVALRPFDGSTGTSTTYTYYNEENGVSEIREVNVDKILTFVQLGWNHLDTRLASASSTEPWVIDFETGRIKAAYSLDMGGKSIENIKAISSASGKWSIDEDGNMIVKSIDADDIKTKTLKVGESGGPSGVTLFDESNGQPYCIKVVNGSVTTIAGSCIDNAVQNPPPPPPPSGETPPPAENPPPEMVPPPVPETTPPPPADNPPPTETPPPDSGLGGITQDQPPPVLDEPPLT